MLLTATGCLLINDIAEWSRDVGFQLDFCKGKGGKTVKYLETGVVSSGVQDWCKHDSTCVFYPSIIKRGSRGMMVFCKYFYPIPGCMCSTLFEQQINLYGSLLAHDSDGARRQHLVTRSQEMVGHQVDGLISCDIIFSELARLCLFSLYILNLYCIYIYIYNIYIYIHYVCRFNSNLVAQMNHSWHAPGDQWFHQCHCPGWF